MAEFLLELFSEEIPANLQSTARINLLESFKRFFEKENIIYKDDGKVFSTPNRLVIVFEGLEKEIKTISKEIKGPKIDAPKVAIDGFVKSNNLIKSDLYKKKIEKAIKESIKDVIAEESIIGQDGKKKIKIPVKGIKEYRFVYGKNEKKVGSAPGKSINKGQVIGEGKKKRKGSGSKPGNQRGEEFYEVEITLEELASYLFDGLNLPDLQKKRLNNIVIQYSNIVQ